MVHKIDFRKITKTILYPVGEYISKNLNAIEQMAICLEIIYINDPRPFLLWCRGSSGAMIAAIIASKITTRNVFINHVKKDGEKSHMTSFCCLDEQPIHIIVDDLISSGATILKIHEALRKTYIEDKIDCLCIGSSIDIRCLNFIPLCMICNYIYLPNHRINEDEVFYIDDCRKYQFKLKH